MLCLRYTLPQCTSGIHPGKFSLQNLAVKPLPGETDLDFTPT